MTPEDRPRPQFEPPPWETEAFERFRQEQDRMRDAEELDRALASVRVAPEALEPVAAPEPVEPVAAEVGDVTPAMPAATTAAVSQPTAPETTGVPQARIDAMLAELRVEEAPSAKAGPTLIYSAMAFMGTTGVFMMIAALVLFAKSKPAGGSGTIIAALASMVMLLTGLGCIAGAIALYRKHHQ